MDLNTLFQTDLDSCPISGMAIDSRKIQPGDVFVAVTGNDQDGLDFIDAAIEAGAVALLVEEGADPEKLKTVQGRIPVVTCPNVRKTASLIAAALYPQQPSNCVAITGTNGKSSMASFLRQLWHQLGHKAASLGTLGLEVDGIKNPFESTRKSLTTPDVVTLHQRLQVLKEQGVEKLAFEASSHGLDQHRLDGVKIQTAIFTNFSQDHLDYHRTMDKYFAAKLRLFTEVMDQEGVAIINMLDSRGEAIAEACKGRGLRVVTYGGEGCDIELVAQEILKDNSEDIDVNQTWDALAQDHLPITLRIDGKRYSFILPLTGNFQVENIMGALAALWVEGVDMEQAIRECESLQPISGRLEPVVPKVYVDYAHTPEALECAVKALSHKDYNLWVVFGCGGDRDHDKRPLMGKVVSGKRFNGRVIVTDDNPRTEDPAKIRNEIMATVPNAIELGDRREAIRMALHLKGERDRLLIAGKGHETYQIIGDQTLDFDDREEVRKATTLWTSEEAEEACNVTSSQPWKANGVSIDTRTLQPGDLFVALKGEAGDGHDYVAKAFEKGAVAAVVSQDIETDKPLLKVKDTLKALEALGKYARDRATMAKRIAVTGSVGKTTTKEMMRLAFSSQGLTHASVSSYNNHWGVPLTLARMPRLTRYAIFELGMNHPGEITPLTKMVKPHLAMITNVAASHLGHFDSVREIARAKAEIFQGLEGGPVVLNRTNEYYDDLMEWAHDAGVQEIYSFGDHEEAHGKIVLEASRVEVMGQHFRIELPDPGYHHIENSAAVLLAAHLMGGNTEEANKNLKFFAPPAGRGNTYGIIHNGVAFAIRDESYNANPASMEAALNKLGMYDGSRKIAVLGDMRELGVHSSQLHKDLKEPLLYNKIDQVYCCGPYMKELYESLPSEMKAGYTEASVDLIPLIQADLRKGDMVMVKGSLGTKMKPIVEALLAMDCKGSAKAAS